MWSMGIEEVLDCPHRSSPLTKEIGSSPFSAIDQSLIPVRPPHTVDHLCPGCLPTPHSFPHHLHMPSHPPFAPSD